MANDMKRRFNENEEVPPHMHRRDGHSGTEAT
jgi:hypothetical protein